ncbi:MAG: MFS transporter [Kordiimonas sp.]|nr:MFS transporter [Kordiimonas sp.]
MSFPSESTTKETGLYRAVSLYLRPRLLVVFCLGIASGFPLTLTLSTLGYWLAEEGVTRSTIGLFAMVGTPYSLKFLWSPVIDRMPLPVLGRMFGRRRSWLFVIQGCLAVAVMGLGSTEPGVDAAMTGLFAVSVAFFSASQDIVIDAYRIEILKDEELPAGSAMIQFGSRVGYLVAGAGALLLADVWGWQETYFAMTGLLLFGTLAVLYAGEPEEKPSDFIKQEDARFAAMLDDGKPGAGKRLALWMYEAVVLPFKEFMTRPGWLLIVVFVLVYKMGDSMASIMTAPLLVDLDFSKAEIAYANKVLGFASLIVGTYLGGLLLPLLGMYRGLLLTGFLMMISNLSFAVLADMGHDVRMLAFAIGFENFASGMGLAVLVTFLSGLCNVAFTATQYALLSSLAAVGRNFLSAPSGVWADMIGWVDFFVLTTVAAVPGLILLWVMKRRGFITENLRQTSRDRTSG